MTNCLFFLNNILNKEIIMYNFSPNDQVLGRQLWNSVSRASLNFVFLIPTVPQPQTWNNLSGHQHIFSPKSESSWMTTAATSPYGIQSLHIQIIFKKLNTTPIFTLSSGYVILPAQEMYFTAFYKLLSLLLLSLKKTQKK